MGSDVLVKKFETCSEKIKRDIVFAPSLYLANEEDEANPSESSIEAPSTTTVVPPKDDHKDIVVTIDD